jgi:hypothetical protein
MQGFGIMKQVSPIGSMDTEVLFFLPIPINIQVEEEELQALVGEIGWQAMPLPILGSCKTPVLNPVERVGEPLKRVEIKPLIITHQVSDPIRGILRILEP